MANNRINRYIGAVALGALLMAMPGCTDTWDDHYNSVASSGTTQTLWDVISANPNYSRFADILQHAKYYKDNTHAVSTYSFADILDGGQVNTVWVPDNTALTEDEYQKWMGMLLGESRADGDNATASGFNVQQQFLGNHIALWRHNISEAETDTVKMINGKNLVFVKNPQNPSLGGQPLGEYNIPTANGVMHVLKGIAPFHYNFYEYLKYTEPRTKFGEYVVSKDTTYFYPQGSIEGLPDENGNPTYVDSMYFTSNRLFEYKHYVPSGMSETWLMPDNGFDARINNEDSVFVMLMPTDQAWDQAYEKLKYAYTYASTYEDKSKGDLNATNIAIKDLDPDSLQKMNIEMDMISPLVFNLHKQPKRRGSTEMWTLDMFKTYKGDGSDYLLNTYGDTLRTVGDWNPSDLFNVEPIDMSNGIAYEVTSWNFPKEYYTPDVEVEIESGNVFYNTESNKYKVGPSSKRYTFSNEAYKDITNIYGRVSNNNFYHLDAPGPTSQPKAEFKLYGNNPNAYVPDAEVMRGLYDIQIVVVPRWYMDIANASKIDEKFYMITDTIVSEYDITDTTFVRSKSEIDTNYVKKLSETNKYKFRVAITYANNASKDKTSSWYNSPEYNFEKVDTITVVENFEFPYSYKNMLDHRSYPTLVFEGLTGKNDAKEGYVYDIIIDKIILKRKD